MSVAGLVLLGGPAWAQEADPCAPGPDGTVPEMCTTGPVSATPTPTADVEPEDPCAGSRPVEPGDGQVSGGGEGVTVGEPAPGTEPDPVEGEPRTAAVDEDGVVCAFAVPISAPVDAAAGGAGPESAGQLPRTGPYDRLLAATAVGGALVVVVGAGVVAAGRRRTPQV